VKGVSGALVTLDSVFSSFCFFTDGGNRIRCESTDRSVKI